MTSCNFFRFPKNPTQGMEVCDKYGVIWKYDATINNWVGAGRIQPPSVVSEKNDGIIDTNIKKKLDYLRQVSDPNKPSLKIFPGTEAYWYYLRSSNKTIRFQPESEERLRVEVDHGRLYQLFYKIGHCPGPSGDDGNTGIDGDSGIPAPNERCYAPSAYDKLKLDFAIYVPTPLTLENNDILLPNCHVPEVSVRLYEIRKPWQDVLNTEACEDQLVSLAKSYKDIPEPTIQIAKLRKQQASEICDIQLSQVIRTIPVGWKVQELWSVDIQISIVDGSVVVKDAASYIDVEATKESIKWDAENNIVCGSIFLKESAPEPFGPQKDWAKVYPIYAGWCLKARQKGPDGLPGDDADCRIKIGIDSINNSSIVATSPIINVRYDRSNNTIYYQSTDIITEYCAEKVVLSPNSDLIADNPITESDYAGVEVTLDECKTIAKTSIPDLNVSDPKLNLVKWTPQGGCVTTRYFTAIKYDWNETLALINKYPFPITYPQDKSADESCCKEDFFYCKSVRNAACPEGTQ